MARNLGGGVIGVISVIEFLRLLGQYTVNKEYMKKIQVIPSAIFF